MAELHPSSNGTTLAEPVSQVQPPNNQVGTQPEIPTEPNTSGIADIETGETSEEAQNAEDNVNQQSCRATSQISSPTSSVSAPSNAQPINEETHSDDPESDQVKPDPDGSKSPSSGYANAQYNCTHIIFCYPLYVWSIQYGPYKICPLGAKSPQMLLLSPKIAVFCENAHLTIRLYIRRGSSNRLRTLRSYWIFLTQFRNPFSKPNRKQAQRNLAKESCFGMNVK